MVWECVMLSASLRLMVKLVSFISLTFIIYIISIILHEHWSTALHMRRLLCWNIFILLLLLKKADHLCAWGRSESGWWLSRSKVIRILKIFVISYLLLIMEEHFMGIYSISSSHWLFFSKKTKFKFYQSSLIVKHILQYLYSWWHYFHIYLWDW